MADKYVNLTDLTYYHGRLKTIFASQADLTALDDKVDEIIAEGGEPNTIDSISVNNTPVTPDSNKNVDISVPTKVSDLTNDSNFQTGAEVTAAINSAVSSVYRYKGSVATRAALDSIATKDEGDVYDVQESGLNYAWDGTKWDPLGQYVDTSLLWAKSELVAITTAEIDTLFE